MKRLVSLGLTLLLLALSDTATAQSPKIYRDKNGYFAVPIPDDWRLEDFDESIRSKVRFHFRDNSTRILLIVSPTSSNAPTDFETYFKAKAASVEATALRQGYKVTISRSTRSGEPVVSLRISGQATDGAVEMLGMMFAKGNLEIAATLAAGSVTDLSQYEPAFRRFMDNLVMLTGIKSFGDTEVRRALADSKKRQAELHMQSGNLTEALAVALDGLAIDPKHSGLLAMERDLRLQLNRR